MIWTKNPPTDPGYYWIAEHRPDLTDTSWCVGLVEVWKCASGLAMTFDGTFVYAKGDRTFMFGDKVIMPEGPEGDV